MIYSIKQLSEISGINKITLRSWEERYGFLVAQRSDTNIRKYSTEQLLCAINTSALLKEGLKISKIAKKTPSAPQGRPKASRDPPRRPPGNHFGLILKSRKLIFEPFKRPFRSLRAPHHTIENTVRNHFPKDPLRPLRDRCAQHRRLSGRFGAAGPLEIRPLSLQAHLRPWSEAIEGPESTVTSTASEKPSVYRR